MSESDCTFCSILRGEREAAIVDEDEHTVAFMYADPATRGHALVIPRRHFEDLYSVNPEDLAHTARAAQRLALRMRERLAADGVNLINACRPAAWQLVFHFHLHVVPRYTGDPVTLPWTPAPGDPGEIAAAAGVLRG
jgi:histidine triad (HIT) family protein